MSTTEAASELSPKQRTALEKILTGCTLADSARAAGVTRMTLYRWLNKDPNFQAAYNAWQRDALLNARTKLLSMADSAVNTVGLAVQTDPRLAFNLLQSLGILNHPTPGPTDPKEIEQRMQLERAQSQAKLSEDLLFSSIPTGLCPAPRDDRDTDFSEDEEFE